MDRLKQDPTRNIPALKDYNDPWELDNSASSSSQSSTVQVIQKPSSSKPTYADIARPSSPTGSDETVIGYNSSEGKPVFAFRNNK